MTGPLRALLALGLLGVAAAVSLAVPGDLDLRFGTDGKRVVDLGGGDQALDVAVRPDGRIALVGFGGPGNDMQFASFETDGLPDSALGMTGSVGIDLGGFERATASRSSRTARW